MPDFIIKNLNLSPVSADFCHVFNFSVQAGSCMGITGPSGIGKSILLKALADMLPHQGEIFFDGLESQMIPAPQWRRKVALLPAESQWWCDTVGEHFQEFDELLFARLGFEKDVLGWQISHLSSGEKQRLACIRLLMNQPEVLLLDEPTANLDKSNRANLEALVSEQQKEKHMPVIWISHDKSQLERVCQQLMLLNKENYELKPLAGALS